MRLSANGVQGVLEQGPSFSPRLGLWRVSECHVDPVAPTRRTMDSERVPNKRIRRNELPTIKRHSSSNLYTWLTCRAAWVQRLFVPSYWTAELPAATLLRFSRDQLRLHM